MKICLVAQEYPPETARGGISTQTWNKAHALARLGHEVHVLSCAGGPATDLRTESAAGVSVHRMPPPDQDVPTYQPPTYWLAYSWQVLRYLHRLRQSIAFDLVDFPEYGAEGFAYQLDRTVWNWLPVVVQLHGPLAMFVDHIGWPERGGAFHRVGTLMEELSIREADALMACSANIADLTARLYRIPREQIDVVHCGVDAEAFRPEPVATPRADRFTVLFVGNIAANKGIEVVVQAVLRLRQRYPAIRLQVLGLLEGSLAKELQRLVHGEQAEEHIEFAGFVERAHLPAYYQAAEVFCSPAQYEGGVANVYLEAMACACPVIASTAGAAPEVVIHEENGLLVPPDDVATVEAALAELIVNPSLRQRLGQAGRRRVEEYFAMDRYIQRVLAVYARAIDRSGRTLARRKGAPGGLSP